MQLDLSQLIGAITNNSAGLDSAAADITDMYAQIKTVSEGKQSKIIKIAEQDALAKGVELTGKRQAQQNSRDAAAALGGNMDVSGEIITALGLQMKQNFELGNKKLDEINAKQSVGFLDNPLEFLMNQLTVDQDYQQYNYHADKYNLARNTLADVNTLATTNAQRENAIAATMSAGSVAAELESVKLRASILADDAKVESIARGGEEVRILAGLRGQQLDNQLKIKSILNEERNWNLRLQESARQARAYEQQFADKALKEEDDAAIAATINAGRKFYNLPPIAPREVSRLRAIGGDVAKQLQDNYITGASMLSSGRPMISSDPGTSAEILMTTKAPMHPEFKPVKDFLISSYNTVRQGIPGSTIDTSDPKEVRASTATYAAQLARSMQGALRQGDTANIYSLPPTSAIISQGELARSKLFTDVLKPVLDSTSGQDIDPQRVVSLTTAEVKAGRLGAEEAARDLGRYFAVAKELNNAVRQYEAAGLAPQSAVNLVIDEGYTGTKTINFNDPVQVKKHLLQQLNRARIGTTAAGIANRNLFE